VSPKSRGRKRLATRTSRTRRAGAGPAPSAPVSAPSPPSGPRVLPPGTPSDDPLLSELRAAHLLAGYAAPGGIGVPAFLAKVLDLAGKHPERHVAAMVAAVGSLLPGQLTAAVVTDLVRSGVLMPARD
jgi:hypothetical protein